VRRAPVLAVLLAGCGVKAPPRPPEPERPPAETSTPTSAGTVGDTAVHPEPFDRLRAGSAPPEAARSRSAPTPVPTPSPPAKP